MKLKIAVIIMMMVAAGVAIAQNPSDKFRRANQEYQSEHYARATELYEELIKDGYENADIYYNLGNAYFKQKQLAPAIVNYERALRLDPGNEDIRFNLRVANLRTVDNIEKLPRLFIWEWLDAAGGIFASGGWAWIAIALLWIALVLAIIFFIKWQPLVKRAAFFGAMIAFVLAIASFAFAWKSYTTETARDRAIVFTPSVYVKSSPGRKGTDLFILHEGTKVRTIDRVGKWVEIRLANGNVGWVPRESIEII
ncbi:MAG: tetratricopeptide repeat protein [Candidatus Kapaibacterium sp.]